MTTDLTSSDKNRELLNAMIVAAREENDVELLAAHEEAKKERNKRKNDEFNVILFSQ